MFIPDPHGAGSISNRLLAQRRHANTSRGCLSCLGAILLLSGMLFGQEYSASLSVTVSDPSNALVPGAHVVLRDGQQVVKEADTSSSGGVIFAPVQPRDYSLE